MSTMQDIYQGVSQKVWGTHRGKAILLFRLTNRHGAYIELMNYGATLVSVVVPDKQGIQKNVILGYPSLEGYIHDPCYIGSTIGRFANRIGGAQFNLDGKLYSLEKNDNAHTNHGGLNGFNSRVFDYSVQDYAVSFNLYSSDGEGGYPGNLQFSVTYTWNDRQELHIQYKAVSDKKTVMNFTNHAYFNLTGESKDIFGHNLTIQASKVLESRADYIPTGAIIPANEKSFYNHAVKSRVETIQGKVSGLNTYYIFDEASRKADDIVGTLHSAESGIKLDIATSYPGVQLYTGDYLQSIYPNNHATTHKPFDGLCLECQYYPDSPNHEHFPSTVREAGRVYNEYIVYKFSTLVS
ncbi:MAG TPA: aldose epimerase family protein [Ohtaekwangia sp.]|uniref:aldose epimerase family protein n=1 Tax=Ohtaekwangia sp. TaxID=2066019 RepID=UPI002F926EA8